MQEYIDRKKQQVKFKIDNAINKDTVEKLVLSSVNFAINDTRSKKFQQYYFETINNTENYYKDNRFFHNFKSKYALQGIDNAYLDFLEQNKQNIMLHLNDERLTELYFVYFAKAKLQRKEKTVNVDLGSFFAKLVHTFKPKEYCALDNPIKNYFGLEKESFYIAFKIISSEYKSWVNKNQSILSLVREQIKNIDKEEIFKDGKLADMKILDLLFWSIANEK